MKTILTSAMLFAMSVSPALADIRCEFGTNHPCPVDVPEPGTVAILGAALVLAGALHWAKRRWAR